MFDLILAIITIMVFIAFGIAIINMLSMFMIIFSRKKRGRR